MKNHSATNKQIKYINDLCNDNGYEFYNQDINMKQAASYYCILSQRQSTTSLFIWLFTLWIIIISEIKRDISTSYWDVPFLNISNYIVLKFYLTIL